MRKYFRSRMEANYARYLQWRKQTGFIKKWEHEPHTFWFMAIKRGCRSVLLDFRVTTNKDEAEWHEVKGWMDKKSATKLKRMNKYYPLERVIVIDKKTYKKIEENQSCSIEGWEYDGGS